MPVNHLLLVFLVVCIWGVNFLFVKFGLDEISPLMLCAARFVLASVPAIFFIKPPKGVPIKELVLYGLVVFALQFGLLFIGMEAGMPAGMTSLIIQMQVFFSMFFAMLFLKEKPNWLQVLGALVSFGGIVLLAMHFNDDTPMMAFVLILAAAATWGFGNLIAKKIQTDNWIAVIIWSSLFASIPMILLVMIVEGPHSFVTTFSNLSPRGIVSLLYIVYGSTWFGYGIWNWLISRHSLSTVVPFTLMVPVVAIIVSVVWLDEPFEFWQLMAGLLVLAGLSLNIFSTRTRFLKRKIK